MKTDGYKKDNIKFITHNKKGELHSYNDHPAIVLNNGIKIWYKNGKKHRDSGKSAEIHPNGFEYWYIEGKLLHTKT